MNLIIMLSRQHVYNTYDYIFQSYHPCLSPVLYITCPVPLNILIFPRIEKSRNTLKK